MFKFLLFNESQKSEGRIHQEKKIAFYKELKLEKLTAIRKRPKNTKRHLNRSSFKWKQQGSSGLKFKFERVREEKPEKSSYHGYLMPEVSKVKTMINRSSF